MSAMCCLRCDATVAVVFDGDGQPGQLFEFEVDRFTVSPDLHVCWPRGERVGRLIEQRRVRGVPATQQAARLDTAGGVR